MIQTSEVHIRVGNRVTIRPRGKKKTWTADFFYDGQHRRQSLRTSNKKVAIDRATKLEHELLHGTYRVIRHEMSIAQAIEDYVSHHTTEGSAQKTIDKYRGQLDPFRDFCQMFGQNSATAFRDVSDGETYTMLLSESQWGVWSDGWNCCGSYVSGRSPFYDGSPNSPPATSFGSFHTDIANIAMVDGSARSVNKGINRETFRRLVMRNDGEQIDGF